MFFPPSVTGMKRYEHKQVGEGLQPEALNASLSGAAGVITAV